MQERRADVLGATVAIRFYVLAVLGFGTVVILVIGALAYFVPESGSPIATVVGVTTPILVSLLGGGIYRMAVAMDGQLSQLVRASEEKAHAEGVVEGLTAPRVPAAPPSETS